MGTELSSEQLEQYSSIARRFALRWCKLTADAEDAAQEALLRLIAQREVPRDAVAWFYVVTRRVCNEMRIRAATRRSAEDGYATAAIDLTCEEAAIDVAFLLQRLSPRDRSLLELVREGVSSREIAARFGCKTQDVGQMVARARRKARAIRDQKKSSGPS